MSLALSQFYESYVLFYKLTRPKFCNMYTFSFLPAHHDGRYSRLATEPEPDREITPDVAFALLPLKSIT